MKVDNFKNLEPILEFGNEHDFYFVQLMKRRKDNPNMDLGVKRIKTFSIFSKDELNQLKPKIIQYCEEHNARAYIRLNIQNAVDVSLRCGEKINRNIRLGQPHKNRKIWQTVAGQEGKGSYWSIDIDKEHLKVLPNVEKELIGKINYWRVQHKMPVQQIVINPTVSGTHLLTPSFNPKEVLGLYQNILMSKNKPQLDINKDGNTLLYANLK